MSAVADPAPASCVDWSGVLRHIDAVPQLGLGHLARQPLCTVDRTTLDEILAGRARVLAGSVLERRLWPAVAGVLSCTDCRALAIPEEWVEAADVVNGH